jgi:hypothetical protein
MNDDPNLARLEKDGDPLEILICQARDQLFPVLSPYARVWAQHVFPRRVGDGSLLVDEWMPFGSDHYTALIRLHHAYCAKGRLLALCKKAEEVKDRKPTADDYALLLHVHATCAAFWENLGSAIDNFAHVWDDARRILLGNAKNPGTTEGDEPIAFKGISADRYPLLNYAYDRRTQFIHSALVPKRFVDGMVVFNLRHYDDKATDWLPETEVIEAVDAQIVKEWEAVLKELGLAWERLFSWLQSKDKKRPEAKVEQLRAEAFASIRYADQSDRGFPPANAAITFTTPPSGSSPKK